MGTTNGNLLGEFHNMKVTKCEVKLFENDIDVVFSFLTSEIALLVGEFQKDCICINFICSHSAWFSGTNFLSWRYFSLHSNFRNDSSSILKGFFELGIRSMKTRRNTWHSITTTKNVIRKTWSEVFEIASWKTLLRD